MTDAKNMALLACEALEDKKASDIKVIDIEQITTLADYFIIASGSNRNQVQAMADNVDEVLGKAGYPCKQTEGYSSANWILLDYGDIVIHLFDEEKRESYEKDRQHTEDENVEDYYKGTDIEKMEEIARQVPLSQLKRPEWDMEAMKNAGFQNIVCDQQVWKEVWTEEEILNNSTSPIFLLEGHK